MFVQFGNRLSRSILLLRMNKTRPQLVFGVLKMVCCSTSSLNLVLDWFIIIWSMRLGQLAFIYCGGWFYYSSYSGCKKMRRVTANKVSAN